VARRKNGRDTDIFKLGYISDDEITNFLSEQYRVPIIDLATYLIEPEIIAVVPRAVCEKHRVIPVSRTGRSLIVAMADPSDLQAVDDLKAATGYNIEPVVASEMGILEAIARYYCA